MRIIVKASTKFDFSFDDFPRFELLSTKEKKFWIEFKKKDLKSCYDILLFLSSMEHSDIPEARIKVKPKTSSIAVLKDLAKPKNYKLLYRGFFSNKKLKLGDAQVKFSSATFWSNEKSWAEAFASDVGDVLVSTIYNSDTVLIDLNVTPWVLGPDGREPEIILVAGEYDVKVLDVI